MPNNDDVKLTSQGVRSLDHLGPKRPGYARDIPTRRTQKLCAHHFEHKAINSERYDECLLCRVAVSCVH